LTRIYCDTHCHLDLDVFSEDRDEVLGRARAAGMIRLLNPGIDLKTSRAAVTLSTKYDDIFAAVGVHPNDALTWQANTAGELRALAEHSRVVAIGEIGLDYYRDHAPRPLQKKIFQEQLDLAAELNLPVIIHNRDASDDLFSILSEWYESLSQASSRLVKHPGVLHSFNENAGIARRTIDMGFYIGVNGVITFPSAKETRFTIQSLPLETIVLETDAPYLAPQTRRGKRNEPAYIPYIIEHVAELYRLPTEKIAEVTTANADELFNWGKPL
jgi:TatD DNase family protein